MFALAIARRYLVPKRGRGFLSLITWISVGGVFLGVLALVVVLAVMNGFENEVKARIVGTNAHAFILSYRSSGITEIDRVLTTSRSHPEVVAAAPFVYGKALVTYRQASDGVAIKAIDLEEEAKVTELLRYVEAAPGGLTLKSDESGVPGILLGAHVAENLSVPLGGQVQLLSPRGAAQSPFGYVPRVRNYRVAGTFRSGMYEYDASLAFVDLAEGQNFFGAESTVTGIELRLAEMYHAPRVVGEVVELLGGFPYRGRDWIEMNSNLFAWMQTEKLVMFVILALIVLVAAFNIAGALIMLVMEKKRDIGILRSMGATSHEIGSIFVMEGAVIGGIGMTLGTICGLVLCAVLDRYELIKLPGDVYFIDTLPIDVQAVDVVAVLAAVLVICLLATVYPAWRASRLDPVAAIRDEG